MTRKQIEAEAEARIVADIQKRRAFEDRRYCLNVSLEAARDPSNSMEVLARAECMHRWLSNKTVH